jgi:outer membrane lipoprotein SlyB
MTMDTTILRKNGILYPLLVIAATLLIIFSIVGIATMTGMLPRAESMSAAHDVAAQPAASAQLASTAVQARSSTQSAAGEKTVVAAACVDCGVVQSIKAVTVKGKGGALGMIAGGVTGALLGNQIGRGNGNAIATVAGAAGGAFAGNEIQKNVNKKLRYQVRVHMDNGTYRTVSQASAPAYAVGDKVRVVKGRIVAA